MKRFIRRRFPSIVLILLIGVLVISIFCRACYEKPEEKEVTTFGENEQVTVKLENQAVSTVCELIESEQQFVDQVKADAETEAEPLPEEPPEPVQNSRYADVAMSDEERELMAEVIYLEAGNQSAEGQQAVAEVIFNRVIHSGFPNNVHDVLWEKDQFSVMPNLSCVAPGQAQYDAIDGALYGDLILDSDVVFFSRGAENDRIWGRIGDHVFCREYIWR